MTAARAPYLSDPYRKPKRVARKPKVSETDEHKAVADFFSVGLGGSAVAMHLRNERHGAGQRIEAARMGVLAGCPDWLIVDAGRALFIELKPRGWWEKHLAGLASLNEHEMRQAAVHTRLRLARADVAICETLDEVIAQLRAWGVPVRIAGEGG
jgi:hypothetical protein